MVTQRSTVIALAFLEGRIPHTPFLFISLFYTNEIRLQRSSEKPALMRDRAAAAHLSSASHSDHPTNPLDPLLTFTEDKPSVVKALYGSSFNTHPPPNQGSSLLVTSGG
ncbi:unnamed protein product [Gadus morhua 'NCC']